MGGGSGGGAVYATFTNDNRTWSCDKTYTELKAAYDAGSVIVAIDGTQHGSAIGVMKYIERDGVGAFGTDWVVSSVTTTSPNVLQALVFSSYGLVDGMGAFVETISGDFQTD